MILKKISGAILVGVVPTAQSAKKDLTVNLVDASMNLLSVHVMRDTLDLLVINPSVEKAATLSM